MNYESFIGQAQTAIDEKGRSSFPREFRRLLSDEESQKMVVAYGPQRSLILFVLAEYEKFMEALLARPKTPETETFRRRFHSSTHFVGLDGQNRIMLTKKDLEYANLGSEVLYVARSGKTLELWNPTTYESMYGFNSEADFSSYDAGFYDDGFAGVTGDKH
jgi:division/cell wall cluster transcriptional repressor MraZ